jgi:hypothetical protein
VLTTIWQKYDDNIYLTYLQATYDRMFSWIVQRINEAIDPKASGMKLVETLYPLYYIVWLSIL